MSKTFKATWLGDTDPTAQMIYVGDLRFIKGEAVNVPSDHEHAEMLKTNPTFATEADQANVVEAHETAEADRETAADEGTERGALKAQLRALGHDVKGNPSVDTLRNRLADATKDVTPPTQYAG